MILINNTQAEISLKLGNTIIPDRGIIFLPDQQYVNNVPLREQINALLTSGDLTMPPNVIQSDITVPNGNRGRAPEEKQRLPQGRTTK